MYAPQKEKKYKNVKIAYKYVYVTLRWETKIE